METGEVRSMAAEEVGHYWCPGLDVEDGGLVKIEDSGVKVRGLPSLVVGEYEAHSDYVGDC